MKITITGDLGSGKSTVGAEIAKRLGAEFVSTGMILRAVAGELGISILDLNKTAETTKTFDSNLDAYIASLADKPTNLVIDSRLAWHFIPLSYKVYLTVDPDVAAVRVQQDQLRTQETYATLDEAKAAILTRRQLETQRFWELYGVNCADQENYYQVIDTSHIAVAEVVDMILDGYRDWASAQG